MFAGTGTTNMLAAEDLGRVDITPVTTGKQKKKKCK